jgi:hypothetical protein
MSCHFVTRRTLDRAKTSTLLMLYVYFPKLSDVSSTSYKTAMKCEIENGYLRPKAILPYTSQLSNIIWDLRVLQRKQFRLWSFGLRYNAVPYVVKTYKLKTKLRGLSPQANYTDRATAAVGEVVPTFADRGVLRCQRSGSPRPLISVF